MSSTLSTYSNILVAIDFSPDSEAALRQAVWLARKMGARIVLAHSLPDVMKTIQDASYESRISLFYGDGELFQRQIRQESDDKLKSMAAEVTAPDVSISHETLLGEPYIEIIHAVHAEGYDLVIAGTKGRARWKEFFIGSTAKRLVRKCPSSVWIVTHEQTAPPKIVLAATDFSDVSSKAIAQALSIAQHADAELHLLHVVDSLDVPEDLARKNPRAEILRNEIDQESKARLHASIQSAARQPREVRIHVAWGTPWKEICAAGERLQADLIALGTVGRGAVRGLLLGNTAESVLSACHCSVLTVKPDDFVSPISPAFWKLHPDTEEHGAGKKGAGGQP